MDHAEGERVNDTVKLTADDVADLLRIVDDPRTRELHIAYGDFVLIVRKPECEQAGEDDGSTTGDTARAGAGTAGSGSDQTDPEPRPSGRAHCALGGS